MNENPDWLVQAGAEKGHEGASPVVTLQLPPDLVVALQQRIQQSGQSQAEVILALLRSACKLAATTDLEAVAPAPVTPDLQSLRARLTQLETLIPRLEVLEGKLIAF